MLTLPFLLPLHRQPIPSFDSEWLAMALGLCAVSCLLVRGLALAWPPIVLAPLGLAGVVAVQIGLEQLAYTANGLAVIACLAWAALLMGAGATFVRQAGVLHCSLTLAWALLAGAVCSALIGLIQWLAPAASLGGLIVPNPPGGLIGNVAQQNHYAAHLAFGLLATCWLRAHKRLAWPVALACVAGLSFCLLLSGARSGLLYLALSAGFGWRVLGFRLVSRAAAMGGVAVAVLALAVWQWFPAAQGHRLMALDQALGPRAFLWGHAWQMFLNHPLLGVGFDGFAHALFQQVRAGERVWGMDQYAHQLILQLLAVSGVAGLLALLLPLGGLAWRLRRHGAIAGHGLTIGLLLILAIHSAIEQPLYYTYFLGLAALLLGMLDPACWRPVWPRWSAALAVGAGGLAMLVTLFDYHRLATQVYGEAAASTTAQVRYQVLVRLQRVSLLAPLAELAAPELVVPLQNSAESKLQLSRRLMQYAPTAEVSFRHAALLAAAGQGEAARQHLRQAMLAYPDELLPYAERFRGLALSDPLRYASLADEVEAAVQARSGLVRRHP
jgi:O-antigen ligase